MTEGKTGQKSFVIWFLDNIDSAHLYAIENDQWSRENRWWQERGWSLEGVRGSAIYCTSRGINFREYEQTTHTNRRDGGAEIQIRG